jgi:cytochrome c oxidase subunit 2
MRTQSVWLVALASALNLSAAAQFSLGQEQPPAVVKISAKRFTYVPDLIVLKKGVPVTLELTSQDVKHGFSAPQLNLHAKIEPGKTSELKFTPNKVGTYEVYCDVFCGPGHDDMSGTIKVVN